MTTVRTARSLLTLLRPYRLALPAVVALGLLASLAEGIGIGLFIPLLQSLGPEGAAPADGGPLVDRLGGAFAALPSEARLRALAAAILAAIVAKAALTYGTAATFRWLDARAGHDVRAGIFRRLLEADYAHLERRDIGRLLNTLTNESWRATEAVVYFIRLLVQASALVVYVGLLLLISWPLTLGVLAFTALVAVTVRLVTRRVREHGETLTATNDVLAGRMVEGVEGMREIRAFGRERDERARFEAASGRVRGALLRMQLAAEGVQPLYEVAAGVLVVAVLLTSAGDPSDIPALLVFLFVLYRMQPAAMAVDRSRVQLAALGPSVEAVAEVLHDDWPEAPSGTVPFEGLGEGVRLDEVTYAYGEGAEAALRDVSLQIPARKTTALVGPSGAGKSTLVKLLLRFYDGYDGEVWVDGTPLRDLDVVSWRRRVAYVSQDVYLFNATVRENIAYGLPGADPEAVVEAAQRANAHDFIEALPGGYEARVGDRGVRLSGGQRQRITLARALIRDPEVLFLDEATNALDGASERAIQDALERFSVDRTVVVIAHRLSTIRDADHVVVLDRGRVVEAGPPADLLRDDGAFAAMVGLDAASGSAVPS